MGAVLPALCLITELLLPMFCQSFCCCMFLFFKFYVCGVRLKYRYVLATDKGLIFKKQKNGNNSKWNKRRYKR